MIRVLLNKLLSPFKLKVVRKDKNKWAHLSEIENYAHHTVLDIGAANGTPKLYDAFKNNKFIIVEPQEEYRDQLESWNSKLDAVIIHKALSGTNESKEMHINSINNELSSFQNRHQSSRFNQLSEVRFVDCITLDHLTDKYGNSNDRYVLKIDVEGYELEVLRSGVSTLIRTDLIIIEMTFANLFDENYNYLAIMNFLQDSGFQFFDILDTAYGVESKGLVCADFIYIRKPNSES